MSEVTQSPEKAIIETKGNTIDINSKLLGISIPCKVSIKPDADSEDVSVVNLVLNFANATVEDILVDAVKSIKIRYQAMMRKQPEKLLELNGQTVEVDVMERAPRGGSQTPEALMRKLLKGVKSGDISEDQVSKLKKDLQKIMKGESQ